MSRTYKDADRPTRQHKPAALRDRQNRTLRRVLNNAARKWDDDRPIPSVVEVRWSPRCGCCW